MQLERKAGAERLQRPCMGASPPGNSHAARMDPGLRGHKSPVPESAPVAHLEALRVAREALAQRCGLEAEARGVRHGAKPVSGDAADRARGTPLAPCVAAERSRTMAAQRSSEAGGCACDQRDQRRRCARRAAACAALLLGAGTASGETIMQIQGATHRSPLAGAPVRGVRGVVTARTGSGFYVQDADGDGDPATSDALFVYTRRTPGVTVGDRVEVAGTVFEYRPACSDGATLEDETCSARSAAFHNLSVTELVAPSVVVLASGAALPPATWIGGPGALPPAPIGPVTGGSAEDPGYPFDRTRHALDFFESLEAMRVAIAAPLVVGAADSFGVLPVLADRGAGNASLTPRGGVALTAANGNGGRILLDDALEETPDADVGDALGDVEGVVDYRYGGFRVHVTQAVAASEGAPPRQTARPAAPDRLSIAAFNVENLSAASPRARIDGIAAQIATQLGGPALVALAEMQDDDGAIDDGRTSAAGTFGALTAAIAAAGGPSYAFVQIDPADGADGGAPGANIRVGFLYDPARIAFGDGVPRIGDATTAVGVDARGRLDLDAGRIDPGDPVWSASRKPLAAQFRFGDRRIVAIALHLRSKLGDGPLFGRFQPPIEPSRAARAAQADVIGRFVERLHAADPGAAIVVLGDCNDFDFTPALARLEAAGLRNLTKQLPENERYSFVFEGNAQALDHVLVSEPLAGDAHYAIVHTNSEYRAADRASDHDPVLAELAVPADEPYAGALAATSCGALAAAAMRRSRSRLAARPVPPPRPRERAEHEREIGAETAAPRSLGVQPGLPDALGIGIRERDASIERGASVEVDEPVVVVVDAVLAGRRFVHAGHAATPGIRREVGEAVAIVVHTVVARDGRGALGEVVRAGAARIVESRRSEVDEPVAVVVEAVAALGVHRPEIGPARAGLAAAAADRVAAVGRDVADDERGDGREGLPAVGAAPAAEVEPAAPHRDRALGADRVGPAAPRADVLVAGVGAPEERAEAEVRVVGRAPLHEHVLAVVRHAVGARHAGARRQTRKRARPALRSVAGPHDRLHAVRARVLAHRDRPVRRDVPHVQLIDERRINLVDDVDAGIGPEQDALARRRRAERARRDECAVGGDCRVLALRRAERAAGDSGRLGPLREPPQRSRGPVRCDVHGGAARQIEDRRSLAERVRHEAAVGLSEPSHGRMRAGVPARGDVGVPEHGRAVVGDGRGAAAIETGRVGGELPPLGPARGADRE